MLKEIARFDFYMFIGLHWTVSSGEKEQKSIIDWTLNC